MRNEHTDPPASADGEHVQHAQDKPSAPHPMFTPKQAQVIFNLHAVKQERSTQNTQRNIHSASQKSFWNLTQYYLIL